MNMRVQIICGFLLVILLSNTHNVHADDKTINRLLNNQAIVSRQIMCVLEKSPCDQLGRQLKEFLPDAIRTGCSKCSAIQKRNSKKVINHLRTRRPQDWKNLTDKYDPEGLFNQRLEAGLL